MYKAIISARHPLELVVTPPFTSLHPWSFLDSSLDYKLLQWNASFLRLRPWSLLLSLLQSLEQSLVHSNRLQTNADLLAHLLTCILVPILGPSLALTHP